MGSAVNRGQAFRMAQRLVRHHLTKLLGLIEGGKINSATSRMVA
jgi:heme oxygenase